MTVRSCTASRTRNKALGRASLDVILVTHVVSYSVRRSLA